MIEVSSDSDWAGDKRTRKSTSGGVAVISGGAIKHWGSTQGTIALSVGEAEYYAMIKAAAEGLGLAALGKDMGFDFKLRLWVDSNAAKAIASRLGLGRVRHMEVKYLWAQEAHRKKRFEIRKVAGLRSPGDILTKPLSASDISPKLAVIGGALIRRAGSGIEGKKKARWADLTEEEFSYPDQTD